MLRGFGRGRLNTTGLHRLEFLSECNKKEQELFLCQTGASMGSLAAHLLDNCGYFLPSPWETFLEKYLACYAWVGLTTG
jgi:hypothetical protein